MTPERDQAPPPREVITDARRPVRLAALLNELDADPRPLARALAAAKGRILTHATAAADVKVHAVVQGQRTKDKGPTK